MSPPLGGTKRSIGGATASEITQCSSFSPKKLAITASTRAANPISSISSYLMCPHSDSATTNSSNVTV